MRDRQETSDIQWAPAERPTWKELVETLSHLRWPVCVTPQDLR